VPDPERLHAAAQEGDLDEVRRLVSEGEDVNAFDELGKTPLHYAVDSLRLVFIQGADLSLRALQVDVVVLAVIAVLFAVVASLTIRRDVV